MTDNVIVYPTCNEAGCTDEGDCPCWLPDSDRNGESDYDYCWIHARENGFCPCCGMFWAGVESFDFRLNGTDLCENCRDSGDYDDDNYDDVDDMFALWDYRTWQDIIEGEEGGRDIGPGSESAASEDERMLSFEEIDDAMRRCGMQEDDTCMLIDSQYCKKECPIRRDFEAEGGVLIVTGSESAAAAPTPNTE